MKFEYNKEKYVDLGLILKHGNVQNIVMFWDENEQAASYNLEIYRINWQYKKEGSVEVVNSSNVKPVCIINVERNKFYHSINDLPCGDYIVCLKIEDRSGEVCAESAPYYFHIEDTEKKADERAGMIARAAAW